MAGLEHLAEHVGALNDDDPRFVSLAEALSNAHWTPDRLGGFLYSQVVATYGLAGRVDQPPDEFITRYARIAVGIVRANRRNS